MFFIMIITSRAWYEETAYSIAEAKMRAATYARQDGGARLIITTHGIPHNSVEHDSDSRVLGMLQFFADGKEAK